MGVAGLALELKFSPSALDFLGEGNDPRGENAPPFTGWLKCLSGNDSNRRRCFPFVFPPPLFSSFVFKIKADSTVVSPPMGPQTKIIKRYCFFIRLFILVVNIHLASALWQQIKQTHVRILRKPMFQVRREE